MRAILLSRPRAHAIVGMGTVVLLACLPGAAIAAEQGEEDCPVVATAQGVQVMVSASDNLFLQAPSGVGIPVAQACVNYGVEESTGFASSPYPGETVVSAPALLRGQTGQPIPGYPAYASSRYPSEEKSESEQHGHSLSSHSTQTSTRARAGTRLGQDKASGETTALAEAVVDPARQVGRASATSDTQPWTVNGVLRLGQMRSVAKATTGKDGKVVRSSRLQIGRTEVAGQVVEITPDGVKAVGKTLPLPKADPAKALAAAGVRVRYLRAKSTEQGVMSAGIEVLARQQDPKSGAVYTVQYVFGRAFAAADRVERVPGGGGPPPPAELPATSGGDGGAPAEPAPEAPAEEPPADSPGAPGPDSAAPAPDDAPPARLIGNPIDMGVTGLYLVLAFGAVATFAFGTLLRLLGVRTRWTS
ncbi:hypothetical protein [Streptomyces sp. KR80]|uniref:hypothetical protein n=1 Tax=Streptomyces sp. KR80 TaxID=3457426 RepID=UPI003FD199B8